MSPAVLVGIEEVIRVPSRAESDHDHEDRIGKRHEDPCQRLPSPSAHPVSPREDSEEDDGRDRSQGVQDQFTREPPVARRVDQVPVDEADDAGRHGEIAEQPELLTHVLGLNQNPPRAERNETACPRCEVGEVLLRLEFTSGQWNENLRRFCEDDHGHKQSCHQLRNTVADLAVGDGFSAGHCYVLSEGACLHFRSKTEVQNLLIIPQICINENSPGSF